MAAKIVMSKDRQVRRVRRQRTARRATGRLLSRRSLVILAGALLVVVVAQRTWGGTGDRFPVVSVVDGDTINVRMGGRVESVRLIGIDTPEMKTQERTAQCFGPEASAAARGLLAGKAVRLEFDASQGRRDRYGRLLAFVWVDDVHINEWLVRQGYAREFTYSAPYRYQAEFKAAEAEARAAQRGLWSASTCGGRT